MYQFMPWQKQNFFPDFFFLKLQSPLNFKTVLHIVTLKKKNPEKWCYFPAKMCNFLFED